MNRHRLEPVAEPPVEVLEGSRVAARAGSGKAMILLAGRTRRRRNGGCEGGNSSGRAEHLFGGHRRGQHRKVRGGGRLGIEMSAAPGERRLDGASGERQAASGARDRVSGSSGGQAPSPGPPNVHPDVPVVDRRGRLSSTAHCQRLFPGLGRGDSAPYPRASPPSILSRVKTEELQNVEL